MSLGNSYFKEHTLLAMAEWARDTVADFACMVLDSPHAYTLRAFGEQVDPAKAASRARRDGNQKRNQATRALHAAGVGDPQRRVWTWEQMTANATYRRLHQRVQWAYEQTGSRFRWACRDYCTHLIRLRQPDKPVDSGQVDLAVRYLLAEVPWMLDTAGIVGAESSVFAYHQRDALTRMAGVAAEAEGVVGCPRRQGFVVLSAEEGHRE